MSKAHAKLILENGQVFEGEAFGYLESCVGEVVFNTGMTGYQEILTDPSYFGQIVVMTYPLIGNYGINFEDLESATPKVRGFVVREKCDASSNFRSEMEIDEYLKLNKVMGISGVDTRALTRMLRNYGTMRGLITLGDPTEAEIQSQIDTFDNRTAVYQVTTETPYHIEGSGKRVAIMDYGVKNSIVEHFRKRGCDITVYPAGTTADAVLASEPELVFLSNGPGDPKDVPSIVGEVKKMIDAKPVVGICLGHQLIALAMGGSTGKLKFGHHGCNHPVKDLRQDRVFITSQNHGYYVEKLPEHAEITHKSMNDDTVEGMRLTDRPVFSVQFHPEAAPGPVESDYLFDQFLTYAK